MKYHQPLDLIGNTPIVQLDGLVDNTIVLAKYELYNLTGSTKDKMASYMLQKAEDDGKIQPGGTIIEATTGNTGIAFSALSAMKGYKMIAVMPERQSIERVQMIKAFGATVIETPYELGPQGAVDERDRLAREHPEYWVPGQFESPDNIEAQMQTTAREIIEQTNGEIDAIIDGVGTGGTLMGCAQAVRADFPSVRIIAVEPSEAPILSGGKEMHHHNIQGIGEGFIPKIVDASLFDQVVTVSTEEAIAESKSLARTHGILVGFSSGANLAAIKKISKKNGERFLTFLCDRGERYLSLLS